MAGEEDYSAPGRQRAEVVFKSIIDDQLANILRIEPRKLADLGEQAPK